MLTITLSKTSDQDAIGQRWVELEARADCSFFQSWAWVGCLMRERFDAPLLLEARRDSAVVAMAMLNGHRRWPGPRRLALNETGRPSLDAVFIEHNGVLLAESADETLLECLKTVVETGQALTLSGVNGAHVQAAEDAGAILTTHRRRLAPYVDLAALRRAGSGYLGSLSANTRYQLRRSAKGYAARGPLQLVRADSEATAHSYLDALGKLHQTTWVGRGQSGAFANPHFVRFHHRLIERAYADGSIDLLCLRAGDAVVGYLYNFRFRGNVSAYQSGFDYAAGLDARQDHQKPGLTCHHLAIEHYLAVGLDKYDFLAGEDRYKTSLGNAAEPLFWVRAAAPGTLLGLAGAFRSRLRAQSGRWRNAAAVR